MADFQYTAGLDDAAFEKGMRRMRRAADRTGAGVGRSMASIDRQMAGVRVGVDRVVQGFAGIVTTEKAISIAARAMRAYGEATGETTAGTRALKDAVDEFNISLGRDLTSAAGDGAGGLATIVSLISQARRESADFVANIFRLSAFSGNDVSAVNDALRGGEALGARTALGADVAERERALEIARLRASGSSEDRVRAEELAAEADFQRARRENIALQERANERNRQLGLTGEDALSVDVRGLNEIARAERDARIQAAREGLAQEEREKEEARKRDRDRANADETARAQRQIDAFERQQEAQERVRSQRRGFREDFVFEGLRGELRIAALEGRDKEVELLQVQLDLAERIHAIRQREFLTVSEQDTFIGAARAQAEAEQNAIRARQAREDRDPVSVRRLGVGLASSIVAGQVFTGAARQDPAIEIEKKQLSALEMAVQKLTDLVNGQSAGGVAL